MEITHFSVHILIKSSDHQTIGIGTNDCSGTAQHDVRSPENRKGSSSVNKWTGLHQPKLLLGGYKQKKFRRFIELPRHNLRQLVATTDGKLSVPLPRSRAT